MKKNVFFAIILIVVIFYSASANEWKEYYLENGDFSVEFPSDPEKKIQQIPSQYGILDMNMLTYTDGNSNFTASYTDYPLSSIVSVNIDSFLNGARDGALKNTNGKLISEKVIQYKNHPGREIKFSLLDGKAMIRAKYYLVRNRLYQILVVAPPADLYNKNLQTFYDSFKLTEGAGLPFIEQLLTNNGYNYNIGEKGEYHITLRFEDNRTHLVRISPFVSNVNSKQSFDIWSVVAKFKSSLPDSIYHKLLVKNGEADIGRFQCFKSGDEYLLAFSAVFNGIMDQKILKKIVVDVASISDTFESQITQKDDY